MVVSQNQNVKIIAPATIQYVTAQITSTWSIILSAKNLVFGPHDWNQSRKKYTPNDAMIAISCLVVFFSSLDKNTTRNKMKQKIGVLDETKR